MRQRRSLIANDLEASRGLSPSNKIKQDVEINPTYLTSRIAVKNLFSF